MKQFIQQHWRIITIIGLFFFLCSYSPVRTDAPSIVITEVGAFESSGNEWIEIFNASSEAIDLTDWKFWEANVNHGLSAPSGTSMLLAPLSYALIVQDVDNFLSLYPATAAQIFDSSWGSLNLSGETLGIKNPSGELVEVFVYPAAPNDRSLERIDPYLAEYTKDNWRGHPNSASPGVQNVWYLDSASDVPVARFTGPLEQVQFMTSTFDGSESYGIGALSYLWRVEDENVGDASFLSYRFIQSGLQNISLQVTDTRGFTQSTSTQIMITATTSPNEDVETIITAGSIVINEVVPQPISGESEWVELYNTTTNTVSLVGIKIVDGVGDIATVSGSISAGAWVVVEIDGQKLNNAGDLVSLQIGDTVIDSLAYGNWSGSIVSAPSQGRSIARTPDGSGQFVVTTVPTPGAANSIIAPPTASRGSSGSTQTNTTMNQFVTETIAPRDIVINEFMSDPETGEDEWVEIYNTTSRVIALDGLSLVEGSGAKTLLSGSIAPNNFLVVTSIKGNLNNAGDTIAIVTTNNYTIDRVTYGNWESSQETPPAPIKGQSLARTADGEDSDRDRIDFVITTSPTQGSTNRITASTLPTEGALDDSSIDDAAIYSNNPNTKIRITELLPNPAGDDGLTEYIELTNIGTETISLNGWILGDATRTRYTIPDIDIAPQRAVALYRSDTNIALNNSGTEVVTLYTPDNAVHDTVTYSGTVAEGQVYLRQGDEWTWTSVGSPGIVHSEVPTTITNTNIQIFGDLVVYIDMPTVVGIPISFDTSDSVFKESDVSIEWLFSDQTKKVGPRVIHTFSRAETAPITVRVLSSTGTVLQEQIITLDIVAQGGVVPVASTARSLLTQIRISEVLPNPEGDDTAEYIELYNPTNTNISLTGLILDDEAGGSKPYSIPDGIVISANSYLVFPRSETKLALNNTGDEVRLLTASGDVLTSITFDTAKDGLVYVLLEDETYDWSDVQTPGRAHESGAVQSTSSPTRKQVAGAFVTEADLSGQTISIEDIPSYPIGSQVFVEGTIVSLPGVLGAQFFYIVDSSAAGVQVYLYNKEFPELRIGDRIRVQGEITESGNERRIKLQSGEDITVLGPGETPIPKTMEIVQMTEDYIGWFLGIDAEITEVKSTYLYIDDGTAELKVYIKKGANIPTNTYAVGELVRVIGILGPTSGGVQLLPRSVDDIITTGVTAAYTGGEKNNLVTSDNSTPILIAEDRTQQILFAVFIALTCILLGLLYREHHGKITIFLSQLIKKIKK
jgi:hypothetical protein